MSTLNTTSNKESGFLPLRDRCVWEAPKRPYISCLLLVQGSTQGFRTRTMDQLTSHSSIRVQFHRTYTENKVRNYTLSVAAVPII